MFYWNVDCCCIDHKWMLTICSSRAIVVSFSPPFSRSSTTMSFPFALRFNLHLLAIHFVFVRYSRKSVDTRVLCQSKLEFRTKELTEQHKFNWKIIMSCAGRAKVAQYIIGLWCVGQPSSVCVCVADEDSKWKWNWKLFDNAVLRELRAHRIQLDRKYMCVWCTCGCTMIITCIFCAYVCILSEHWKKEKLKHIAPLAGRQY